MINTATFSAMEAGLIFRPAYFTVPDQPSLLRSTLAILILAYGSGALTEIHTTIENAMIQIRKSDHYLAARARGAKLQILLLRHLIPEINNIVVHRLAFFIGGLVILEKVLLLNGAGAIFWNAAELRDYPLVLALSVLSASLVALVRLGAELTNHLLDPRPVGGVLK
jgi:ABC-type dipeptide/oligopeptide/nickel transport system permease component